MSSVVTTGGGAAAYTPEGLNRMGVRELLAPIEQTARLCGMEYLPPYLIQGTHRMTQADIEAAAGHFVRAITALHDDRVDLDAWRRAASLDAVVSPEAGL
jgi:glutathione-regulated potassium-efflux system ancillary protein KefG